MSFIGLSPFIQIYIQKMKSQRLCVNALYRASSISTGNRNSGDYNSGNVSMPFIGLSPFLHVYLVQNVITKENVSMPFIGLSPFLHMSNTILKNMLCQCQCPLSGFLHFYIWIIWHVRIKLPCVNALYRAFSISTNNKNHYS